MENLDGQPEATYEPDQDPANDGGVQRWVVPQQPDANNPSAHDQTDGQYIRRWIMSQQSIKTDSTDTYACSKNDNMSNVVNPTRSSNPVGLTHGAVVKEEVAYNTFRTPDPITHPRQVEPMIPGYNQRDQFSKELVGVKSESQDAGIQLHQNGFQEPITNLTPLESKSLSLYQGNINIQSSLINAGNTAVQKQQEQTIVHVQQGAGINQNEVSKTEHLRNDVNPHVFSVGSAGSEMKYDGLDGEETAQSISHSAFQNAAGAVEYEDNVVYRCKGCGISFNSSNELRLHSMIHISYNHTVKSEEPSVGQLKRVEKRFQCLLCEKTFSSKNNLKQHNLIHSGVKPYQCTQCDKPFTRRFNLNQHMQRCGKERKKKYDWD